MRNLCFILLSLTLSFSGIAQDRTQVLIRTSLGDILLELYDETPQHRDNFIKLVSEGYYDGSLFHRVMPNFMIQGGDPESKTAKAGQALGTGGPGYRIPAEFVSRLFHKKGALAAAREPDAINPKKASSGSQFYIVEGQVFEREQLLLFAQRMGVTFSEEQIAAYCSVGGTPHLDGAYTVFGEVIKGLEIVEKATNMKRDQKNRPLKDLKMSIKIIK